jgi:TonB family protein
VDARPRFRWSLLAALAAHAGAFGYTVHAARAMTERAESRRATELDVEVEAPSLQTTEVPAPGVAPAIVPARQESAARAAEARSSPTDTTAPQSSSSAQAMPSPAPSADSANGGSWSFSPTGPTASGTQLSSAALDDAVRASVHVSVAEARTTTDPLRPILGGFTQHDIELGLVPGGEFVNLTRDAIRTSRAPDVGHATLEFQIDAAGRVASVHVLDASSDRTEWDEAAAQIARAARSRVARVPSGSRGFVLRLEVNSSIRTVSGRAPTDKALVKVWRAVNDPVDALIDGNIPATRVVAARIVDMHVL